jgi:hypothetical protein
MTLGSGWRSSNGHCLVLRKVYRTVVGPRVFRHPAVKAAPPLVLPAIFDVRVFVGYVLTSAVTARACHRVQSERLGDHLSGVSRCVTVTAQAGTDHINAETLELAAARGVFEGAGCVALHQLQPTHPGPYAQHPHIDYGHKGRKRLPGRGNAQNAAILARANGRVYTLTVKQA